MSSASIYNHVKATINNNVLRAVIIFCMGIFNTDSSWCQIINNVQDSFNRYQENKLQEKIYVHTNKTFYLTGEILWFKVYCVNGSNNQLLDISKVAYVDILDYNRKPVMQAKVSLKRGIGNGSLFIPFH